MLGTGVAASVLRAHADAVVRPWAEQMVDDVEAPLALGIVGAANVDQAAEAAAGIIAQEGDHLGELLALDLDGELAERHLPAGRAPRLSGRQDRPQARSRLMASSIQD